MQQQDSLDAETAGRDGGGGGGPPGETRLFQDHCPKHGGGPGGSISDDVIMSGDRLMLKNEMGTSTTAVVIGQLVGPAGELYHPL